MNQNILTWSMLAVNAVIALVFAHQAAARHDPWGWPPTWTKVVTIWLTSKAMWLLGLSMFWQQGWIDYTAKCPDRARTMYPVLLFIFMFGHVVALFYYSTGRASLPVEEIPIEEWDGVTERRRRVRRASDREADAKGG